MTPPVDRPGLPKRASDAAPPGGEPVQLVTFRIGTEEYALDILRIKEIIHPLRITPVPKAPAFVEGVVELRGTILPVIDMRKRFDLPATPLTRRSKYIIVGIRGRIVGLVVDGVMETLRVPGGELRPPPSLTDDAAAEYFTGVCNVKGRILLILNLDHILTSQEQIRLGAVATAAAGGGGGQ